MAAETAPKPQWTDYAKEVIDRLSEHGASPATVVVAILGYAAENENVGVQEWERSMAKHWLDRLVDAEGNPKDDNGMEVTERAVFENTISANGSFTRLYEDEFLDDRRVVFEFTISARATSVDRSVLHEKLTSHFAHQADLIERALFEEIDV